MSNLKERALAAAREQLARTDPTDGHLAADLLAQMLIDLLVPPANRMQSEDLIMTYVYTDMYERKAYAITLVGPFFETTREARRLVAEREKIPECRLQESCCVDAGKIVRVHLAPDPVKPHRLPVGVL